MKQWYLTPTARGSTSESDVSRRQILSKVALRTVGIKLFVMAITLVVK